jgi:hypothetical protein
MITRYLCGAVACAGVLCACVAPSGINRLTDGQREKVSGMQLLYGPASGPGTVLGRVKSNGCQKDVYDPKIDSELQALEGLKINAVAMDADLVINIACRDLAIDWFSNCWGLVECSGEAFRYQSR